MADKTTGRSRKATKKAAKQPIPIDTGVSQSSPGTAAPRSAATQVSPDDTPATQAYPGIEEEIRFRAYELYVERGRLDGFQEEDWVRAEIEILSRHQREKSA